MILLSPSSTRTVPLRPYSSLCLSQEILAQADYLMFTGSSETGAQLAEQAGRRLIGFSAELGGKNPMIITKTADIDNAVEGAVRACFSNSGQRSEEHTSELQSLMRISYAVLFLKKKKYTHNTV